MNVLLKALGCRLNEAELQTWARAFQQEGHQICQQDKDADLVVVNTCAVTQEAVKKSRQLIRRTQRNNPGAKLIVSGCYASLEEQATEIEGIDLIVPNQNKDRLVEIAKEELSLPTMPSMATTPGDFSLFSPNRSRAFVKVQDGCRYRCSFCIVTVARGTEKSRSIADIVNEVNALREAGVNEVVLTGVHIGGYGHDLDSNLYELIKAVLQQTDVPRLRLGSVEPWDLPGNFFELFENKRFMPHLHLPLQSGSDSVLRRMARRCKTADFRQLVEQARAQVADINISTDIIVGFPGETDSEWQQSLAFIEEIQFSRTHIFSYSKREGTKAATLAEQVSAEIKKRRSRELHTLARHMQEQFLQHTRGRRLPVLWENHQRLNGAREVCYFGYTPNFLRVEKKTSKENILSNQITMETIQGISSDKERLIA